jgi:hypothetical protein
MLDAPAAPLSESIEEFAKRLQKDLAAEPVTAAVATGPIGPTHAPVPEDTPEEAPKNDALIQIEEPPPPKVQVADANDARIDELIKEVIPADMTHDQFVQYLINERSKPAPVAPPPPPLTQRQMSRLEQEMEAGRKRVAYFEQMNNRRVVPPPEPGEHTNVPVFRTAEYQHERVVNKTRTG